MNKRNEATQLVEETAQMVARLDNCHAHVKELQISFRHTQSRLTTAGGLTESVVARIHATVVSVQRAGDVYVSAETLRSMILASQDIARPIRQLKAQFYTTAMSVSPSRSRRPGTASTLPNDDEVPAVLSLLSQCIRSVPFSLLMLSLFSLNLSISLSRTHTFIHTLLCRPVCVL